MTPLPLRVTNTLPANIIAARAARVRSTNNTKSKKQIAADVVSEYLIGADDMATVYVSPDPYSTAFEEEHFVQSRNCDNLLSSLFIYSTSVSSIFPVTVLLGSASFKRMAASSLLLWLLVLLLHVFPIGRLVYVAHG